MHCTTWSYVCVNSNQIAGLQNALKGWSILRNLLSMICDAGGSANAIGFRNQLSIEITHDTKQVSLGDTLNCLLHGIPDFGPALQQLLPTASRVPGELIAVQNIDMHSG